MRAQIAAAMTDPQSTRSGMLIPKLPPLSLNANAPMMSASMPATKAFARRDIGEG
jgi:hypothetical protein